MYVEQKIDKILGLLGELATAAQIRDPRPQADGVIALAKRLAPEDQVRLLEALGLRRQRQEHGRHCTSLQGSGLICTCTPPESYWRNSAELRVHFGETWERRKDAEIARGELQQKADDGEARYEETWGI